MKIVSKILFLFAISMMTSGLVHAEANYAMCGARPGLLERLISDAEKIRIKCIEDAYKANQEAVRVEVAQLIETNKKLTAEIKKVAVKVEYNRVQCEGGASRSSKTVARCNELLKAQIAVVKRIQFLMGWSERPKPKPSDKDATITATPPCPSKAKLEEMKVARMFNRKLFVTYERCVTRSFENGF